MDFADQIYQIGANAVQNLDQIETEEATKTALILPFIQALGYNVFDLNEVKPEMTADVGIKKGEKVDYAIYQDGKPIIIFECKMAGSDLTKAHASQLSRYFHVTDVRFAVLTNGTEYHFFSDLDAPNRMDERPFLIFDILNIKESLIEELKKFTKAAFDVDSILSTANQLKYTNEIVRVLSRQMTDPDEEIVRYFTGQVSPGARFTPAIREQFTDLTRQAFRQFINERVNRRLLSALDGDHVDYYQEEEEPPSIVTTEEEHEGFLIIRAILREVVDPSRVAMRDAQSYCAIFLDDTNRKPLARLHFNTSQKYVGVFDADKNEERIPIDSLNDIYDLAERLKATPGYYDGE